MKLEKRLHVRLSDDDILKIKKISEYRGKNSSGVVRLLITEEYEKIKKDTLKKS